MQEEDYPERFRRIDPEIRKKFNALPEERKRKSLEAKTFILYSFEIEEEQKKPFEVKEQETLDFIGEHLKNYKKCYVSTSFGMDSVAMMSLVIRAAKMVDRPVPGMWLANTLNIFREEKPYWDKMIKFFGIEKEFKMFKPPQNQTVWSIAKKYRHLPDFRTIGLNPHTGVRGKVPECCDILKKSAIKNYLKTLAPEDRYDCHFVGTRAEESRARRYNLMQYCRTHLTENKYPYPMRIVKPLSFWTFKDIEKYYAKHGIPKNPTYKIHNLERMGCASCPAYKTWERTQAGDPTEEGFGMLKMNLKLLKQWEPKRFQRSVWSLEEDIHVGRYSETQTAKLIKLLGELGYEYRVRVAQRPPAGAGILA